METQKGNRWEGFLQTDGRNRRLSKENHQYTLFNPTSIVCLTLLRVQTV
jgi:hypothetical protein